VLFLPATTLLMAGPGADAVGWRQCGRLRICLQREPFASWCLCWRHACVGLRGITQLDLVASRRELAAGSGCCKRRPRRAQGVSLSFTARYLQLCQGCWPLASLAVVLTLACWGILSLTNGCWTAILASARF
jgi:hypothetical protein